MRSALAPRLVVALAAALTLLAGGPSARAGKAKETYIFGVTKVALAKGVPAALEKQVLSRLATAIAGSADLAAAAPADAPDPDTATAAFKKYLKQHRMRAFRVNVEVTQYKQEVEPSEGHASQFLTVHLALRLFGETVPDRVMAFTGDGSATVKLEIGKKLRPRDAEAANDQALEIAVADAIDMARKKLNEPPPSQKKHKH